MFLVGARNASAFPFLPRFGPGSDGVGNFTPSQRSKYQPLEGVLHHFGPEKTTPNTVRMDRSLVENS